MAPIITISHGLLDTKRIIPLAQQMRIQTGLHSPLQLDATRVSRHDRVKDKSRKRYIDNFT